MMTHTEAPPIQLVSASRCAKCGYDKGGAAAAACPECGAVSPVKCVKCGYDLAGLPVSGSCPECGMQVRRSLMGRLLVNSGPEYVATLHKGVFLVLAGIIVQVLVMIGLIFASFSAGLLGGGANFAMYAQVAGWMTLAATLVVLLGWWMFSEPDPAVTEGEKGETARRVVRASLIATAVLALAQIFMPQQPGVVGGGILILVAVLGWIVHAVKFFASMLYVGWLAPRLPDAKIAATARRYMWILPLLTTVGIVLLGLGPLIALVLYWNLLDKVRKHLKAIRAEQEKMNIAATA